MKTTFNFRFSIKHFGFLILLAASLQGCYVYQPAPVVRRDVVPPQWAPAYENPSQVQYYYMPDIETYYDVWNHQYVYMANGNWIMTPGLPPMYESYDLYGGHVVILDYHVHEPWRHHDLYASHYPRYYHQSGYDNDQGEHYSGFDENTKQHYYGSRSSSNSSGGNNGGRSNTNTQNGNGTGELRNTAPQGGGRTNTAPQNGNGELRNTTPQNGGRTNASPQNGNGQLNTAPQNGSRTNSAPSNGNGNGGRNNSNTAPQNNGRTNTVPVGNENKNNSPAPQQNQSNGRTNSAPANGNENRNNSPSPQQNQNNGRSGGRPVQAPSQNRDKVVGQPVKVQKNMTRPRSTAAPLKADEPKKETGGRH